MIRESKDLRYSAITSGIAVRVHRHEQRLQFVCIRAELFEGDADVVERGRAGVWTEGVAEENEEPFAPVGLVRDVVAIRGNERKRSADRGGPRRGNLRYRSGHERDPRRSERAGGCERENYHDQNSKAGSHARRHPFFSGCEGDFFRHCWFGRLSLIMLLQWSIIWLICFIIFIMPIIPSPLVSSPIMPSFIIGAEGVWLSSA